MTYIRNKHGRIVEVDETTLQQHLAEGSEKVSDEEAADYYQRKTNVVEMGDGANTIYYQAVSGSPDGYGMSRDIIKDELARIGTPLSEHYNDQKVGLLYNYPYGIVQMRTDVRLVMTMFESDKIPDDWEDYLAMADEVIVPSKFCQDSFAAAGIDATIVPLGYNDRVFTYVDREIPVEHGDPFTFIHYGSFNMRKGFQEVFDAFNTEFKNNEPVRLILKTAASTVPIPILKSQYPNIEVVSGNISEHQLVKLLGRSNCMVYPSRGEGFGITPLEAMATGLPAIVPNAHGIAEYFNGQYMLEVGVSGSCPGLYHRFKNEDVGNMVVCDVEHLRAQMRHAYNNQAEMKELGKSASEYVNRYTYRVMAEKLQGIIRKWEHKEVAKRADSKYLAVETV